MSIKIKTECCEDRYETTVFFNDNIVRVFTYFRKHNNECRTSINFLEYIGNSLKLKYIRACDDVDIVYYDKVITKPKDIHDYYVEKVKELIKESFIGSAIAKYNESEKDLFDEASRFSIKKYN